MRRRILVLGTVVLVGAALVLFCCTSARQRDATTPTSPTAAAPHAEPAAPSGQAPTPAESPTTRELVSAAPDASSAPQPTGPGARVADAVRTSDPRDLELLSAIERELHEDPPAEVRALIALRKQGANRDELGRAIQKLAELRLRVLAFRWLDEVLPAVDAGRP
jgi:hypothetical protein